MAKRQCGAQGALERALDTADEIAVREAVAAGACLDRRDAYGDTPLHDSRNASITRVLLQFGANVDVFNVHRQTPLHYAFDPEKAQVLLQHGADPHLMDRFDIIGPNYLLADYEDYEFFVDAYCAWDEEDKRAANFERWPNALRDVYERAGYSFPGRPQSLQRQCARVIRVQGVDTTFLLPLLARGVFTLSL